MFLELLAKEKDEKWVKYQQAAAKLDQTDAIVRDFVAQAVPDNLTEFWRTDYINPGYDYPLKSITIGMMAYKDMADDEVIGPALGVINRMIEGLKREGWEITQDPSARTPGYLKSMTLEVRAERGIPARGITLPWKEKLPDIPIILILEFMGVEETNQCKLVPVKYIVERHEETRYEVECSEAG